MSNESVQDHGAIRSQIADEMLQVHQKAYGTGAEKVTTHIAEDVVMVWLDQLEFSIAERTLLEGGRTETVMRTRSAFQEAIEPTFTAIVERATGRQVADFLSTTSLDLRCSVEIFRLQPVD